MLPHKWKAVGFIFAAAALAAGFVAAYFHSRILQECSMSAIIIGLFVAAMSRDRHEDEMLRSMRLASIFHAFCWVVLYVAIFPLIARLFHVPMVSALAAVMAMLVIYHMNFIATKWNARREKHD